MMFRILLISVVVLGVCGTPLSDSQKDIYSSYEIEQKSPIPVYTSNPKSHTTYERYSIPTYPEYVPANSHLELKNDQRSNSNVALSGQGPLEIWSSIIAKSLVPLSSFALFIGAKTIVYAFKFLVVVIISVGLTISLCTFTPLCHITFAGIDFNRTQIAEMTRPLITSENLNKGAAIVGRAIDTFKEMQSDFETNTESEKSKRGDIASIAGGMKRRRRR